VTVKATPGGGQRDCLLSDVIDNDVNSRRVESLQVRECSEALVKLRRSEKKNKKKHQTLVHNFANIIHQFSNFFPLLHSLGNLQ